MSEESTHSLTMLYCYVPEDRQWVEEIDLQLGELKRQCSLHSQFDGELVSSLEQKEQLLARFEKTDLVLLLLSNHFKNVAAFWDELSYACWSLRWLGACRIIALVLEPLDWHDVPFSTRDFIPRSTKPETEWQDPGPVNSPPVFPADIRPLKEWPSRELVFQQIEQELRIAIEKQWLARGGYLCHYVDDEEEALVAYNEALRLNPSVRDTWYGKAHVLIVLERYSEALDACDEALRIDPLYFWVWFNKGHALAGLQCYEEALQAYDKALYASDEQPRETVVFSYLWESKASTFAKLQRYEEALAAYDEAIRLAPYAFHRDIVTKKKSDMLKTMTDHI